MNTAGLHPIHLLLLLLLGCDTGSGTKKTITQLAPAALIVTTDYQSGSYALIDLKTFHITRDVSPVHFDSVCRADGLFARTFVIQRQGSDAIAIVDPESNWDVAEEYSVGPGTNPQDIAIVSPDKAYVSRLNEPGLLIVNPQNGSEQGQIDLSPLADEDGLPEAGPMLMHDDRLFVSLLLLNSRDGYVPGADSRIAVIDPQTDQLLETLTTARANPVAKLRYSKGVGRIVLVESGIWSVLHSDAPFDGAIEYLSPDDLTLSGPIMTEEDLGGDLVDAIIISANRGYAIVGFKTGGEAQTRLVAIDPAARRVTATLMTSNSWAYSDMALSPDGQTLWVADRSPENPGVRVFNTETGAETAGPLDTGLPPQMICFTGNALNF